MLSDDYVEEEIVSATIGMMINDFYLAKDIALRLDHPTLFAMKRAVDRGAGWFAPSPNSVQISKQRGKAALNVYECTH